MDDKILFEKRIEVMLNCSIVQAEFPKRLPSWKNSHFQRLADLISDKVEQTDQLTTKKNQLGTISAPTIKRMLKNDYIENGEVVDKRQLASLHKFSIFVGYSNWFDFKHQYKQSVLLTEDITPKQADELTKIVHLSDDKSFKTDLGRLKELSSTMESIFAEYIKLANKLNEYAQMNSEQDVKDEIQQFVNNEMNKVIENPIPQKTVITRTLEEAFGINIFNLKPPGRL
jgi:hypothetical protein